MLVEVDRERMLRGEKKGLVVREPKNNPSTGRGAHHSTQQRWGEGRERLGRVFSSR